MCINTHTHLVVSRIYQKPRHYHVCRSSLSSVTDASCDLVSGCIWITRLIPSYLMLSKSSILRMKIKLWLNLSTLPVFIIKALLAVNDHFLTSTNTIKTLGRTQTRVPHTPPCPPGNELQRAAGKQHAVYLAFLLLTKRNSEVQSSTWTYFCYSCVNLLKEAWNLDVRTPAAVRLFYS